MAWRRRVLVVGDCLLLAAVVACSGMGVSRRGRWLLMQPPEVEDETAPRGHRLVPGAPLSQWHEVAALGSEEECLAVKQLEIDRTIDRAREEVGADAKYELPVRRAVNARCVHEE